MAFDLIVQPEREPIAPHDQITALLAFWKARIVSKETRRAYWFGLVDLAKFIKAPDVETAVRNLLLHGRRAAQFVLEHWKSDIRVTRGLAPGTANNRLAAVRSVLEAARDLDMIEWNVNVRDFKVTTYRDTRGPGLEAYQAMICFIQEDTLNSFSRLRDVAIMRLLFDCGLRAAEVCSLELRHVRLDDRTIEILGKGNLNRIRMTLPQPTAEALQDWIAVRGTWAGPLFVSVSHNNEGGAIDRQTVYRLIRRAGEAVGVKTHPHAIRHLAITTLANADESLLSIQQFARHSNPSTTVRYVDSARDIGGKAAERLATFLSTDGSPTDPRKERTQTKGRPVSDGRVVPRWRTPKEMERVNLILRRAVEEAGGCAGLVDVSGVSRASLYAWMAGKRNLSYDSLESLAAYLGVTLPVGEAARVASGSTDEG